MPTPRGAFEAATRDRPWAIRSISSRSRSSFTLGHIGGHEIAFTNSALFMLIAVLAIAALMLIGATRPRALVPGRLQSVAEIVLRIRRQHHAEHAPASEGMRFFPLVFSLFMFMLIAEHDRASSPTASR